MEAREMIKPILESRLHTYLRDHGDAYRPFETEELIFLSLNSALPGFTNEFVIFNPVQKHFDDLKAAIFWVSCR